jgi:membrane protein DedA with SNARE-associated domain
MLDILLLFFFLISFQSIFTSITSEAGIFDVITETISSWITEFGYPAVFIAALFENLFPPIPSEVIFPLVGFVAYSKNLGIGHAIGMAITGALGSTVGAVIIYFIALKIGKSALVKLGRYTRISESELKKAESWFDKHGTTAVFTGRMAPLVRELISIPAGLGSMNLVKFVLFTFAGSTIWSLALTLVGYYLGDAWSYVSEKLSSTFNIIALVIIVGIVAIIGFRYFYKRNKEKINYEI